MSAPRRCSRLFTTSAFGALALAALWASPAQAQLVQNGSSPAQSNGTVPTIDQSVPNTTTVTLGGSRTVIDWDKFDINSGDTANFVFANRSDIVLNRVGGAGSTINGNLNGTIGSTGGAAGGNIWIYNANGVVIGANARVSTGGLLVTTAAVDRATDSSAGGFLDGGATSFGFTGAGTGNITVQNGAQITSHGGAIALVAPVVTAEAGSSLSAQNGGNVLIGSAAKYKISFRPTSTDDMDLLSFEVADGAGTSGTDAINLAGDISGNRVFVAAVSKSGLVASIMNTGTISANTVATDETGAIVLSANHDIVNGAAAAAPLSGIGAGYVTTLGGAVTGPKLDFVASENVLLRGDVGEAGAVVNLHSDNTDIRQFQGVITADTLTASAQTGINFNSFSANRVDKLGALSTVTGDLAYIGDEDGVILTGAISAPGKVTLGARGFMDTTTGSISAGGLELSLGGGGSFKVNGDANLSYGQSQGAVTIHATGGITLSNEFGMILGSQLSLTADTGAIRETGGFISGGGAVVVNAAGEIDLGGANSFTSLTANSTDGERITVNATGNLDFKVNTFSLARFTVGGDATSSGTNALNSGGLFVTAGGAINLSSDGGYTEFGDLSAGGNITLAMDGNLVLGGVIHAGNALSLTSRGGAIRQTSGTISLGTSFTLNAVTGIDLNQTGNHLGDQSLVSMATGGTGSNVRIRGDAMKLYLHGALGNVSLNGESGDVVVGPGLTASSLTAEAAGDIQIGSNGNTVAVDTYHRLIGTNVSVYNNGDFTVDGDVGRADVGRVELVAPNGTLTQTAGTIFGSDISLRATYAIKQDSGASVQASNGVFGALAGTDLLLTGANRLGDFPYFSWGTNANVTIRSLGNLSVDTSLGAWLVPVHTLKLISDEGSVGVYGGFTADTLNVQAHGDIMLDDATYTVNKVGSVTGLTSATGNISLREDNGFDINGDISAAAGNITLKSDGAIETYSGALSLGGTLAVTAGGGASLTGAGAIKLGAVSTSGGGNFYLGSDGNIELTGAINTGTSNLILSTTNGAITSNGGTISAFSTTANATGAITLVGSGFANFWATSTGGGDIHLSGDNDVGFAVNTSGDVTVESGNVASNTGDMIAGSMSITAVAGINLTDPGFTVDVGSFSRLHSDYYYVNVDIQGDIKLDGDVFAGDTGSFVSLKSGGSILQNSGTIAADRILLNGASAITQADGAALDGGALSLTSNGNVTLDQANAFTSIADLAVGSDLTLRNLGSIDLDPTNSGGFNSGGKLTLISDTGDITGGNAITTTKLTASAVNGDILFGGGNQINALGTMTAGGDIEIGALAGGFALTGDITATNVSLLAQNGGITQDSGTRITAGRLNVNATGDITLDQANVVTTVGGLNANLFTTGHSITFRNAGGITLDGLVDARGGSLTLSSNTGGISQNNGASIYILANQLFLSGVSDLLLNSASNDIATLGGASNTSGTILYRDANGFDIAGNITSTNGGASLRTAGAGSITQSGGIIDVDYLGVITAGSGNSVTLNRANRIHRLIATSGNGTLSINSTTDLLIDQNVYFDTISLSSGGAITQSNTGSFGAGTANLSAVTGINLPGASLVGNNGILNFGTITNTTSGGINIVSYSGSHINLTGNISAAGQAVSITDVAGYILQTGGVITADTLSMSATGGINVGGANQVSNLGAMTGPGVTFANAGSFNVAQSIGVSAGIYLTSNSGAITQNAGTTLTADTIALNAGTTINQGTGATLHTANLSLTSGGTTTLGEANDFTTLTDLAVGGDLTLRNLGNINLSPILGGTGGYRTGGALTLISDTGNILSTNSGIATSRLTASAAGSISLDGTIASLGTITAGQSILLTTYNGSMVLTGNVSGRNISLYGNTGLSQTGGIIDADRLNVITNGNISLTGANQIDVVGRLDTDQYDSGTGHDITLRNVGAIVLDYQIEAPDGTVTLTSDTGGISQTSFSDRFIAGTLKVDAAGDIVLDYAGNAISHLGAIRSQGGGVTVVSGTAFDLTGQVRATGALSLTSGGAITTNGGLAIAGGLLNVSAISADLVAGNNIQLGTVTTNGNFAIDTDGNLTVVGLLNTNGGDATLKANFGTIGHGASGTITANKVTATARDSISLDSTGNAIVWASSSNGGNINLTGNADVFFKIDTAGDLTVDAGGIAGNNDSVIANSVGINAAGGIYLSDQTVTINVGSYRYLTSSAGAIDVENQGDINLDGDVTSGASNSYVRLNSSLGSLLQYSGTISGYSVELDAAQSVTQDASAKVVAGGYGLSFRATDVSLLGANEIPSISVYTVTHDLTLRAVGTIDMSGSANQAGSNHYTTLISDTGDIIGGPINADRLSATASNGKLVFNYGNNNIGSLGALTAKNTGGTDINVYSDSAMALTGTITGGGVDIRATGTLSQTGGSIIADWLIAGAGGDLLLDRSNAFGELRAFGNGTNANVTIRNHGDLALPVNGTAIGTLTLISDTGSVSRVSTTIAATLNVQAATGIDLGNAGNNFTTLAGLSTGAGDIRIADANGFAIEGNITAPGTVALTSGGNITTGTTTVGIVTTPHGKVDADTLTVSAINATVYTAGDIKLGASSVSSGFTLVADGSIDLTATSNFNGASLIANTGSITQSAGVLTGNTVLTGASGSITLDKNNNLNSFGGTSTGGGAVTFNNVGSSTLDLTVSTTGNAVVTTAGGVLGSYIRAGDLSLTAGGAIDLTFNTDVNSVSKLVTTSGNVLLTDVNSFQILGDVTAGTGTLGTVDLRANTGGISQFGGTITGDDVHLTSVGNLSQIGTTSRIVANTIALSSYAIIFNGANSFNSTGSSVSVATNGGLILRNAGSIDLDALGGFTSGGSLALTSDNGSITSTGAIAATALSAIAEHGTVSFGNAANSFTYLGAVSASGDATFTTSSTSLSLLNNIAVGGRLTLGAQGAITQGSNSTLTAASLYATAGGAAGAITLGAANDVGTLGALTADGDVSFRDINGFQIDGNVRGDHVSLVADAGSIYEKSGSTVIASRLTASAADGLQLNQVGNSIGYIDGLTLSGAAGSSLGIASSGGNMRLAGNVNAAGQYVTFYVAGGSLIQDSGTITAANLGITIPDGSVTLGANAIANLGSLNVRDDFIANADLSSGVLGLAGNIVVGGTTTITNSAGISQGPAGSINTYDLNLITAGTLDMGNVINVVGGQANIAMGSGSFLSYGDLNLRLNATGAATITSGGNINFTGAGSSSADTLTLSAVNGIYSGAGAGGQIAVNHLGTVTNTGSGGIALNLLGNVTLEGDITAAGQTVSITAEDGLSQATGNVITANRLNVTTTGTSASVILDNANVVDTFGLNVTGDATLRSTLATTIAPSLSVGGSLTVNTPSDITMNNGTVGGTLALYSGGAVYSNGYVSANRLTGRAVGDFYLNLTNLTTLDTIESGEDIQINASSSNLNIVGDITAAGGIEISGTTLTQSAGTITTGATSGIGLSTSGAITQTGGRIIAKYISATGGDISLVGANQVGATGNYLNSSGLSITFRNQGNIVANSDFNFGGLLTLISDTGSITQSTALNVGYVKLRAATGIDFSNSGNTIGSISEATNSTSGGIILVNSGDLRVDGGITATGQAVSLTSVNGAVRQTAAGMIGANSLGVSAQTGVQLHSNNNIREITGLSNAVSGGISFNNFLAYELNGNVTAAGQQIALDSTSGGVIQIGGIITAGNVTSSTYGGIRLDGANNVGAGTASSFSATVGDIRFRSANAILLGTVNAPGLLSLTSDSGGITQTVAINAAALSATSLDGDILLDQNNAIGALKDVATDGSFTFNAAGNLTLDGNITAPTLVKLTAAGNLTQTSIGGIHSASLVATSGAGAANGISLLGPNDVTQALLNSNGKDLRFRNTGDFALGNISAAGHIVEMISDGGAVTQLAGTSIVAGTFSATGTNVVLDNTGNQISRIGRISTGSDLSLRNGVALQIDAIDAGSHNVTINNGGDISGGNITASLLTVNPIGGGVFLNTANHVNSIGGFNGYQFEFVNDGSFTIAGAIQNGMFQSFLTSQNGSISMAGGAVNSGGVTLQAATGISITGNLSYVYGATTTTGDVSILSSLLDIQGDITGDTVTLGGTANGGFVRQTSGVITANLLNANGYGSVTLDGPANHIASLGTLSSSVDDVIINSLDAVTLAGNIDAGDFFTLTAGGPVTQTGGRIRSFSLGVATATGAVSLGLTNQVSDSGTVVLSGTDINFRNDGSFTLGNVNADGALALTSVSGSIGQESGTAITADILTASAGTTLGFGQFNHVAALGKLTAATGNVLFLGNNSYDLTDDISSSAGGFVSLSSMGTINQTGGIITAPWLGIDANEAYLDQANQVRQLGTVSSNGDFIFRNAGAIELWGTVNAGYLGLRSNTGDVSNPGALFTVGTLDVRAAGTIDLNGGSLNYIDNLTSQNGDITLITTSHIVAGNLIAAENGTIDLTVGRITAGSVKAELLKIDAYGGDIELLGDNAIAHLGNIFANNISLAVGTTDITGSLSATNSIAFVRSGIASDFALTMAGGTLTTPMLSLSNTGSAGSAVLGDLTTPSGPLELNFNFNGNADITAAANAISLNNAVVDGNLSLTAHGAIINTGAPVDISGTLNAASNTGNIGLAFGNDRIGHFGNISSGAGSVDLRAGAVDITGTIQSSSGTVVLVANNGSVTQAAGSSVQATVLSGSATGDFLLDQAGNSFASIDTIGVTGSIALRTAGNLTLGVLTATTGDISLTAGGDLLDTAGSVLYGRKLSVTASGAADLVNGDYTFSGLGEVSATSFTFRNQGNLDLAGNLTAGTASIFANGAITQSDGIVTANSLTLEAIDGLSLERANKVGNLSVASMSDRAIRFTNDQDLIVSGPLQSYYGDIALDVNGDLRVGNGIGAGGAVSVRANGIDISEIGANNGITIEGGAHDVKLGALRSGDDIQVDATGQLTIGSIDMYGMNDGAGDGFNIRLFGGDVFLGATGTNIPSSRYLAYDIGVTPGWVWVNGTGDVSLRLRRMNAAAEITAGGSVYAQSSDALLLTDVSGTDVTLIAAGLLDVNSVTVPGVYSVTGGDISVGAFNILGGNPLDIFITDTDGDLTLSGNIAARRNTTVIAQEGDVLGSTARLGAGLTMDGTLTVNGFNIALLEASSFYDVDLTTTATGGGTGTIDVGMVTVGRNYVLSGSNFLNAALEPIGTRTGNWTLTGLGNLDLGGRTLEYVGGIDFSVDGLLSNGTIQSLSGSVTGTASSANVYALLAGTDIDVSTTVGGFTIFQATAANGSATLRSSQALNVTGRIEAGTNIGISAQFGAATVGYATAGGDISVYSLFGDATLRQATLTGATGDLTVQSVLGAATLGADDYSSIDIDHYFERAAGSIGSASILGSSGAYANLDHSATLSLLQANQAEVNVTSGDLRIDLLQAFTGTAGAYLDSGTLQVGSASGDVVDLGAQGGDLILGSGGITANDLYLTSDGTIDTTAVPNLSAGDYLAIDGGTVMAAGLSSGSDILVMSGTGGVTIDTLNAGYNATVMAGGDLAIGQVIAANGAQLSAAGSATVRAISAADGFALAAQGNITLGADAGTLAGADYVMIAGGTLGGCGCGPVGGIVVSLGGNVAINLFSVTGVFETVEADVGDVSIALGSGDLGINRLRGHNIDVTVPGVLTMYDVASSGGSYALTAADFGGDALDPARFGGATAIGDITIIDTAGDLGASGVLRSSGDIRVEARGGAITGLLSLTTQTGDVTVIGQGVHLHGIFGYNVSIDAGTGTAEVINSVGVDNNYTLVAGDFAGETLAPWSSRLGSLRITDTVGDFDFGSTDFLFMGGISIEAAQGALNIGNLQAGNAITLAAGGNLSLASAQYFDTANNTLSLTAGGDLRFGAVDAVSTAPTNVFTNYGTALTGTTIRAAGNVAINLYQAGALGGIEGGTVQVAVRTGDLRAASIDAAGAIAIDGPTGSTVLGNLTSNGGHITVNGQGDTTLGDVSGHFVVSLGASNGNLAFGNLSGGTVSLAVARGITGASVSASSLALVAMNGDVNLDNGGSGSRISSLSSATVGNGSLTLRNLQDLTLDGVIEVSGTLGLEVAGALRQNSGYIAAEWLRGSATGAVTLGGDNRIDLLGDFSANGFKLNNAIELAIDGRIDGNAGAVSIATHGGLWISSGAGITSLASGDAIVLASDGLFTNQGGIGALSASNGRWLVYTQAGGNPGQSDPGNDFGGLAGTSYYGAAYDFGTGSFATTPNAGNRFVYGYRPVLTVTPNSGSITYDGTVPNLGWTIGGLVNGDSAADAWSGSATLSGARRDAGTHTVQSALGTLASDMNYAFAFGTGVVVVDPRVISAILTANDKTYDGGLGATGSIALNGVIAGDTVSANGSYAFDDRNAGTRTVTASGIGLTGADAGNYVLASTSATDLADILAKAITATLSANGKTYDGTTAATGALSLNGLIGNDQVNANGSYAFDSKNAGTRTVIANGISLSGVDAGNYVLTDSSVTALADILAKAVTATLNANGKTYDGSTVATGSLTLGGLIGNDQVSANGSYAFESKNAGTRTVTASGISLSGADAGNYVLTGTTATALADILAKAITATLSANGKTYDGSTAATGTLGLQGVVAGDSVAANAAGMAFDNRNAGNGRTVTASGISLSGADIGNYVLTGTTATGLADILAKAITATLAANGRVYDGTTAATGTLGLNGVVLGDQAGVGAGAIAFDSKNAGTRTATASGLTLNGADAGNYTITGTASGSAVISPKAITATATADGRTYDGTTNATGRIALSGLISGDTVTGTASYRFADANAGTGRTVQVSGLALSGADAANYTVTLSNTPVTADIARRAVTVTVADMSKILGQPDPNFTYAVTGGSVVSGDAFTGALARVLGEQAGRYAIGQGTLALSANYLLTVIPGTLAITLTQSGAEASDALKTLRSATAPGFSLDQNPSRNLEGDDQGEDEGDSD